MTRDEAIDKLEQLRDEVYNEDSDGYDYAKAIDMAIEALERKRGEWIAYQDGKYHCSRCDDVAPKGYRWNYCPNCGTRMKEVEDEC